MGLRHRFYCTKMGRHLQPSEEFWQNNDWKMLFYIPYTQPNRKLLFTWIFGLSLLAYAASIYLKSLSRSGNVFLRFVTAKLRVVPLKKANSTTSGVNRNIYFIKLYEYCAWKFKRQIEYWKLLLLGRFTNGTCMD